jgi:hypothetical protein
MTATEQNPLNYRLFHSPKDRLRMTVGDKESYITVKPTWAAPLSHPKRYLALVNGKGEEIATITDPEKDLTPDSFDAVQQEIAKRYLTATVQSIVSAKGEFGSTYWHVESNRGERDFVTQSLQENAQWLSATHLLLIDVDGNRFEIPDTRELDVRSRGILEAIL